jgi:hypothetical protein
VVGIIFPMGIGHWGFHLRSHSADIQVAVILGEEANMKIIELTVVLLLVCPQLPAQRQYIGFERFPKLRRELEQKIDIGMTTDEVRKALGKPTAVKSGAPLSGLEEEDQLLLTLPQLSGQLVSSTWCYYYDELLVLGLPDTTDSATERATDTTRTTYIPIYYVSFDKGTQTVSAKKLFFIARRF